MRSKGLETIVIVGGGIVGSSVAYFLRELGFQGDVFVVERDPSYRFSSTALSAASIRTQFGCALNVKMSLFGVEFFRRIKERFGPGADIGFVENGYLILGTPDVLEQRKAGVAMQRAEGADIAEFQPADAKRRFPWLNVDDLGIGTFGNSGEGWFDAWSLLALVRGAARARDVAYVRGEAEAILVEHGRVEAIRLASGEILHADWCVNAAGALSAGIVRDLGIDIPVRPRKRTVFRIKAPLGGQGVPMVFDTTGAWIRPESNGFICGIAPSPEADPDAYDDFEPEHALLEDAVWPALAHRIPALEQLRLESAWAGHYEVNTLDHNGIIGAHDEIGNLVFATGFSGHGVMHSPATGRGVAELITFGSYRSLDLSPLGWSRIRAGVPLHETVVY